MQPELVSGTVIAARYRLERKLGEGGMGTVWLASHAMTQKPVALKFVKRSESSSEPHRRFLREARAACAVRHPNVREIHDILELDDGAPVMVMEYLRGESLAARLEREGTLEIGELARIMLPVVSAVGTAHALGIVHRDLKPENIFLGEGSSTDGTQRREPIVKVLDFGIAKLTAVEGDAAQTAALTGSGTLLGTPSYMAPEQIFGERDIDHRADLWALGLIVYRALSGILPTQGENVGQVLKIVVTRAIRPLADVAPDVPSDVAAMVGKMLSRQRSARPADLREVQHLLARYAGVEVEPLEAPSPVLVSDAAGSDAGAGASGESTALTPPKLATSESSSSTVRRRRVLVRGSVALGALAAVGLGGRWLVHENAAANPTSDAPAMVWSQESAMAIGPVAVPEPATGEAASAASATSSVAELATSTPAASSKARPRGLNDAPARSGKTAAPPTAAPTPSPPAAAPSTSTTAREHFVDKPPF